MRPPRQLLAKLVLLRARNALEYSACGPVMSLAFLTILGCLHLREPSTGDSVHILCRNLELSVRYFREMASRMKRCSTCDSRLGT